MTDTQPQLQQTFHRDADEKRFRNRIDNPYIRIREERLAARLAAAVPAGGRVLEVGCGEGANLHYLARALPGAHLAGVDFSPEKVAFAARHVPAARTLCADALALPFAAGAFHAVLLRDLLHHVNWARDGVLAEAARVLAPGGVIFVMESDGRALINRLFQWLTPVERGMKDSTPAKLNALCARFGAVQFEVTEPGFLVRAFAFAAGPPRGAAAIFTAPVYACLEALERAAARVRPRSRWPYMLFIITPGGQ